MTKNTSSMTLSQELQWRGFLNQTTMKDITILDKQKMTFYHGFDASADSQTVGNLAAMMFDKVFMRHGYKAVLLAGGATSLIGDPGGKDKERPMQDEATVAHNVKCAEEQLKRVYHGQSFTLVNNLDWFKGMHVIEFLRDIGKHFSMTPLVQRDYIAKRIGEDGAGISYTEFSYTLLQGYDFLHLYREYGVTLQLAGSDQWGNSISGVDLVRRVEGKEVHVMTAPLIINKATGKKFGKSEEGAVWLDSKKTSVYQFYQFWLNTDDDAVEDYLKIYTELDKTTIEEVMATFSQDKAGRQAQRTLAREVTALVHGKDRAASAERATAVLFGKARFADLEKADITLLKEELQTVKRGETLAATLVSAHLASSNTEANRFIAAGAVTINGKKISPEDETIPNGTCLVKRGKNSFSIIEP